MHAFWCSWAYIKAVQKVTVTASQYKRRVSEPTVGLPEPPSVLTQTALQKEEAVLVAETPLWLSLLLLTRRNLSPLPNAAVTETPAPSDEAAAPSSHLPRLYSWVTSPPPV